SDSGLVPPASRTDGDRRLYDAACVARLELVTTLRELGVSLADVRRVLGGQVTAAEMAAIHLEALDTEIRALRLRRAVVAAVVKRSAGGTEMGMINKLARRPRPSGNTLSMPSSRRCSPGWTLARRAFLAGPLRRT